MTDPPPEGDIHIDLGRGSQPPSHGRSLSSWINIVATSVALLAGVTATVKPQDHSTDRATYDELKKAVEENSENDKRNHEDITALRNFLDGYFKGAGKPADLPAMTPWAPPSASVAPRPSASVPPLPTVSPEPRPPNLPDFSELQK